MVNEADFKKKYATLNSDQLLDLLYQKEVLINQLEESNKDLRRRYFSSSKSEHVSINQLSLFNEAEDIVESAAPEELEEPKQIVVRKKKKKKAINLRVVEEHKYPETTVCDQCGSQMKELKAEVKEYIIYKRAEYYVKRVINHVYVCQKCSNDTDSLVTKKADLTNLPARIIEGSAVTSSVVSAVAYQKFAMGLPYYRQAKDLQTHGLNVSRQNLCNWVIKSGELYLETVLNKMQEDARKLNSIHMDETKLNCLEVTDKTVCYEWLLMSGEYEEKQMALYYFHKSREHAFVNQILGKDYTGILHSDGYQAYPGYESARLHVACWAHARRYVFEAILSTDKVWKEYQKADQKRKAAILEESPRLRYCLKLLNEIDKLFHEEKQFRKEKNLPAPEEIFEMRQKKMPSILDEIHEITVEIKDKFVPNGKLGKAVTYILNQWESLTNILKDGKAELSNNIAEREGIKPFVIARKNFMFADTVNGATVSSYYFSLIISAKMNHLNPELYLEYVLEELAVYGLRDEVIERVLPYAKNLPDRLKVKYEHS